MVRVASGQHQQAERISDKPVKSGPTVKPDSTLDITNRLSCVRPKHPSH